MFRGTFSPIFAAVTHAKISPFTVAFSRRFLMCNSHLMPPSRISQICISYIFRVTIKKLYTHFCWVTFVLEIESHRLEMLIPFPSSIPFRVKKMPKYNQILDRKSETAVLVVRISTTRGTFFGINLFGFLLCCPSYCINLHIFHQDCE